MLLILLVVVLNLTIAARRNIIHLKEASIKNTLTHSPKIQWFVCFLYCYTTARHSSTVRYFGKYCCCCCCPFRMVVFLFPLRFRFSTLVLHKYYRLCAECTQFSKTNLNYAMALKQGESDSFIATYSVTHIEIHNRKLQLQREY